MNAARERYREPPAEPEAQVVVNVHHIGTRIGQRWILRGLDLSVRRGETLAVIGASGGGKSLMLRQIIGLQMPNEGRIEVLDKTVGRLDDAGLRNLSRRWGVLFQKGALFSALTVYDNIAFPMRELRRDGMQISESMIADLVAVKLACVGLEADVGNRLPDALSGGMIKRVALARALALDPELLFLDEPTAGLDPASANDFHELYRHLQKDMGLSGLIVTHDVSTLDQVADRVAVLVEGRILSIGTLEEIRAEEHPFIARFFGGEPAHEES